MLLRNSAVGGTSFATALLRSPKVNQTTAVQTATIEPKTAQPAGGTIATPARPGDISISTVAPSRTGVNSTSVKRL